MSDPTQRTVKSSWMDGQLTILDFFADGTCKQNLPGMGFGDKRKTRITTCPDCPGIMRVGECLRDQTRRKLDRADAK